MAVHAIAIDPRTHHCATEKDAGSVQNAAWRSAISDVPKDAKRCQKMNESPEDARLATCGAREITLYTRPGCHLCEEAKAVIQPILGEFGAALRELDINQDAALQQRYGTDIPVIFIGARKVAKHRLDPVKFRRQLSDALRTDC